MSSVARPRLWLLAVGAVSAVWITLGVVTVGAAPRARSGWAPEARSAPFEIPDPALDALIGRFAQQASRGR
ncbi:MAG TPA: hypothetical protein VIU64_02865 [Polyangia bacterium]